MKKIVKAILSVPVGMIAVPFVGLWYLADLILWIGGDIMDNIWPSYIESVEESDEKTNL